MIKEKYFEMNKLIILCILCLSNCIFAENLSKDSEYALTRSQQAVYDENITQILFNKWDPDNTKTASDLAKIYLHILEYSPEVFIVMMERNQKIMDSWLTVVEEDVFVYKGQCGKLKFLECRQNILKSTLQRVRSQFKRDRYRIIVDKIYTKIHNIKPRKTSR